MKPIRAFLGVAISPILRDRLSALQTDLRSRLAPIAWVRPESIHLTLKFLGAIPPGRVGEISLAVRSVVRRRQAFACGVRGLGCFPSTRVPRVLWAGVKEGSADLQDLVRDLDAELAPVGFPEEHKPFRPHLTLARIKAGHGHVATVLRELVGNVEDREYGSLLVDRVGLFQSERRDSASVYTALATMQLSGAPSPE